MKWLPRFRFTLRALLIAVLILGVAIAMLLRWWTQPYAITGSYPSGTRAWEQWERRTVTGQIEHIKTVRFYRNGRKSYELSNGIKHYWSPNGRAIIEKEWYSHFLAEGGEMPQDPSSKRPMESFLY